MVVGLPMAVLGARVVLAEDGVLLREGLAGLLGRFGFETVAAVADAAALVEAVAGHEPDLVITDTPRAGGTRVPARRRQGLTRTALALPRQGRRGWTT